MDMNIVYEAKFKLNDYPPFNVYYLNPLIGLKSKGISIDCYMFFRDILVDTLPKRTIENLDRHVLEVYGDNDAEILTKLPAYIGDK